MISRSTLLHLRFPFSWFLLPIYLLALLSVPRETISPFRALLVFVVLHLSLYPAANGFNSYYDRDVDSIGALKKPPHVTPDLLATSLVLEGVGIIAAFFVSPVFAAGSFIYGLSSKAYSWDKTRFKKYPVGGWLFTGLGQGTLTFFLVILCVPQGAVDFSRMADLRYLLPACFTGCFILGFYPLTQVYQHAEDARRGDRTISLALGVRGTFILSIPLLAVGISGIGWYISSIFSLKAALIFFAFQLPSVFSCLYWALAAFRDAANADFDRALRMSVIASSAISCYCLLTFLLPTIML